MPNKVTLVKTYLDTGDLDLDSIVLSTDAYDVLIAEHASIIAAKFLAAKADLVMGAEANFHPSEGREAVKACFDTNKSKWRYVNGGGYIGYAWAARQLADYVSQRLDSKDYDYIEADDQALQQRFFLAYQNSRELRVRLDTECDIFCSLNLSTTDFVVSESRIRHLRSSNTVSVLHANGGKHNLPILDRYWSLIGGATGGRPHDLRLTKYCDAALAFDRERRKLVPSDTVNGSTVFLLVKGGRHALAATADHGLLTFDPFGGVSEGASLVGPHEILSIREQPVTHHGTTIDIYCAETKNNSCIVLMESPKVSALSESWFDRILSIVQEYCDKY